MPEHLTIPQFKMTDSLSGSDKLGRHKIDTLAKASVCDVAPNGQLVQRGPQIDIDAIKANLEGQGIPAEMVEDFTKALIERAEVEKTETDPVVLLQPYSQPTDFAAQYPQPLDPTEVLTLCEEITTWRTLPEVVTPFNADSWREMDELAFSGDGLTNEGFFLKGGCPDTYDHDGDNISKTRMYLGAQKTLSFEDIKHSLAAASIRGLAISALSTQERRVAVADVKAKEMQLQEILVLNRWDEGLVSGNSATNTLAFDGIETQVTSAAGARTNSNPTGSFDVEEFDNFLTAGCARATHVFGHPKAIREIKMGYLQLGAASTAGPIQQIILTQQGGMVAGFTLADKVMTSIGEVILVPDFRFNATEVGADTFSATVYPLRVTHNGEPIVYKSTQTPLSFKDLTPGCTAISFMIYAVTCLVIKHMCAQAAYTARFTGHLGTGCDIVGTG
jgi:hypothetical protein